LDDGPHVIRTVGRQTLEVGHQLCVQQQFAPAASRPHVVPHKTPHYELDAAVDVAKVKGDEPGGGVRREVALAAQAQSR
jgi:hypothetical protein